MAQSQQSSKVEPNFALFDPSLVKIMGALGRYLREKFKYSLQSNLWYTFDG